MQFFSVAAVSGKPALRLYHCDRSQKHYKDLTKTERVKFRHFLHFLQMPTTNFPSRIIGTVLSLKPKVKKISKIFLTNKEFFAYDDTRQLNNVSCRFTTGRFNWNPPDFIVERRCVGRRPHCIDKDAGGAALVFLYGLLVEPQLSAGGSIPCIFLCFCRPRISLLALSAAIMRRRVGSIQDRPDIFQTATLWAW